MGWLDSLFGGGRRAELEAAVKAEASRHGVNATRAGGRILLASRDGIVGAIDLAPMQARLDAGADLVLRLALAVAFAGSACGSPASSTDADASVAIADLGEPCPFTCESFEPCATESEAAGCEAFCLHDPRFGSATCTEGCGDDRCPAGYECVDARGDTGDVRVCRLYVPECGNGRVEEGEVCETDDPRCDSFCRELVVPATAEVGGTFVHDFASEPIDVRADSVRITTTGFEMAGEGFRARWPIDLSSLVHGPSDVSVAIVLSTWRITSTSPIRWSGEDITWEGTLHVSRWDGQHLEASFSGPAHADYHSCMNFPPPTCGSGTHGANDGNITGGELLVELESPL